MPAEKSARSSERKRLYNRLARRSAKTYVRSAENLIVHGPAEQSEDAVRQAISSLDRAARKGVIHPNNAARRQARLMKKLNQATAKT